MTHYNRLGGTAGSCQCQPQQQFLAGVLFVQRQQRGAFTSSRSLRISSVSLWWVLITSALPLATREALSMRSGLRVPWARKTSSGFRFISPMTSLAICRVGTERRVQHSWGCQSSQENWIIVWPMAGSCKSTNDQQANNATVPLLKHSCNPIFWWTEKGKNICRVQEQLLNIVPVTSQRLLGSPTALTSSSATD